jgi:hypothetical protein
LVLWAEAYDPGVSHRPGPFHDEELCTHPKKRLNGFAGKEPNVRRIFLTGLPAKIEDDTKMIIG